MDKEKTGTIGIVWKTGKLGILWKIILPYVKCEKMRIKESKNYGENGKLLKLFNTFQKCRTYEYMNNLHFLVLTDGRMRLYQIDIYPRGLVIDI